MSELAIVHNIQARAGDTITRRITVTDDGVAVDLTTYTIRATFGFDTPLTLSEGSGVTVVDAAAGIFDFLVTDAQSAQPSSRYDYGVKLEDSSGNEFTILLGTLELRPERVA